MRIAEITVRKFDDATAKTLDRALREVRGVLNGGVRLFGDQLAGQVFDLRFIGGQPIGVKTRLLERPIAVLALSVTAISAPETSVSGAAVTWSWRPTPKDGFVMLDAIDGATAGIEYAVKLAVVEG